MGNQKRWIEDLDPTSEASTDAGDPVPTRPTVRKEQYVVGRIWTPADFRRRSESLYRRCKVREQYHYLINVYPMVLPWAERFARNRLERSMAMLWKGDRPIPSRRYDPAAL
jgi:hypothetical protein